MVGLDIGPVLPVKTRTQWRDWLARNHEAVQEAWLVAHTKASGRPCVTYDDAVEEALCFGWIDSIVKPVGDGSRAQRYTPRRKDSGVSELNRARVRKLVREGHMTDIGLAALPGVDEWLDPPPLEVPRDIEDELRQAGAWETFEAFPEPYRRIRVGWVEGARRREDEFEKRLAYLVKMSAAGKMYGTVPE